MKLICAMAASLIFSLGLAQSDLSKLINDPGLPLTYKGSELPPEYKAVEISTGSEMADIFSTPMMMMGLFMGDSSSNDAMSQKMLQLLQACWTKGEIVTFDGGRYYVTYRYTLSDLMMRPKEIPQNVSLVLIKVDAVKSIKLLGDLRPLSESMLEGAMSSASKSQSLSNAQQIARAMIIYSGDNDDFLPYVQSTASAWGEIIPYCKNWEVFDNPNSNSRYLFAMNLAGVSLSEIPEPANTPMIYEMAPMENGERVVAFADGHVKFVAEAEWPAIEAKLRMKYPRKGKPLPFDHKLDVVPKRFGGRAN